VRVPAGRQVADHAAVKLEVHLEDWPTRRPFRIAYHTFASRQTIRVELRDGDLVARGEGGAHPQLEPLEDGRKGILGLGSQIEQGISRMDLLHLLPRGPARNALDCALWDLECKRTGKRVWEIEGLPSPRPLRTAYTLGIGPLPEMIAQALAARDYTLLKLKVDDSSGFDVLQAVAEARPDAEFVIDANEAWGLDQLETFLAAAEEFPVRLIEQPLPKSGDQVLRGVRSSVPVAADESFHGLPDVDRLADRYQVINIKLDKIGGLTEALLAARAARARGLGVMVGCNGATSLGSRQLIVSVCSASMRILIRHCCWPAIVRSHCDTSAAMFTRQSRPSGVDALDAADSAVSKQPKTFLE
jgi:L-Ala-D/L-Glu epimerase